MLIGAGGADTFAFTTAFDVGNVDRIEGFEVGVDKIALDDLLIGLNPGSMDRIAGGEGDDYIAGGNGDDVLIGGAGADVLFGDEGADTFIFVEAESGDILSDFEGGVDKIDIGQLLTTGAFQFIDNKAFSGIAGQIRFADGVLQLDRDGDGQVDFSVVVEGSPVFASDIITTSRESGTSAKASSAKDDGHEGALPDWAGAEVFVISGIPIDQGLRLFTHHADPAEAIRLEQLF